MKKETEEISRKLLAMLDFEATAREYVSTHILAVEALNCPRCGAPLIEHLPGPRWRRHFECRECWLAFSFYSGRLEPGRDLNPQFLAKG